MSVKRARFAPLEGAELDAAIDAIVRAELAPTDFSLEQRRTEQKFPFSVTVHKLISIRRFSTGTERQYSAGRGGGWPFEFERDLQCGYYGSPPPTAHGKSRRAGAPP